MTMTELKEKARKLPLVPGVYIMQDADNNVIYVGKAKKLKNRVYSYFQDNVAHSPKTKIMVSKIDHFDVIVAASEFEALVLECSLIKQHLPKYNILLKDDKGYPFLRLNLNDEYPTIALVNKLSDDGAEYYGPFGSRSVTQQTLKTLYATLKLPTCNKKFPRDIGKTRPCLNYHMGICAGWCRGELSKDDYIHTIQEARMLLQGDYKRAASAVREKMLEASDELNFELAANLRDHLNAIESLGQKQLVTANALADTDVIGFAQTETKSCFAILHFSNGNLVDKEFEVLRYNEDPEVIVSSLLKQYYLSRRVAPKTVLLPFPIEDSDLFTELLHQELGRKTLFKVPQRGDNARLVALACKNAYEELQRVTSTDERILGVLLLLGKMLAMEPPKRIEAFDISNIAGTDIVAGMVVFIDGRPKKGEYKRFKINALSDQNDYESMRQVILRRFGRYISGDPGFSSMPDLLLIDGGAGHAATVQNALEELGITAAVFGMVKDDRHRTRALVTAEGDEIGIETQQPVFSFIGNIQEEAHKFAISYHRKLRTKRLQYSQLDKIPGVGQVRKQDLLNAFKSISAIRMASISELERVVPKNVALSIYDYFKKNFDV